MRYCTWIYNNTGYFSANSIRQPSYSTNNNVLDILLLLEQKCGNLDSYDLNLTDTKKQEVIPLILNIIFHDNSITIGNKNKIVDSHLMTQRTM